MKFVFGILLLLLISTLSQARIISGYERGNGGMLLECSSDSIPGEGIYSLDRVEGKMLHHHTPSPSISQMQDEVKILE